jgi:Uma2 family endonuclease
MELIVPHQRSPLRMSTDEFLAWAEAQEGRCELLQGKVMSLVGATRAHERVAKRILMALYDLVDEQSFDVNSFGVQIPSAFGKGTVLYPDIVVDAPRGSGGEQSTSQPIVIIEVASSPADYEHWLQKFEHHKMRETLCHYVVFDHKRPRACVWTKTEAGWLADPEKIEGTGRVVDLPSINATVPLAKIYHSEETG